jgi:hypothetical protein
MAVYSFWLIFNEKLKLGIISFTMSLSCLSVCVSVCLSVCKLSCNNTKAATRIFMKLDNLTEISNFC